MAFVIFIVIFEWCSSCVKERAKGGWGETKLSGVLCHQMGKNQQIIRMLMTHCFTLF